LKISISEAGEAETCRATLSDDAALLRADLVLKGRFDP